jgi:hypothetical protein
LLVISLPNFGYSRFTIQTLANGFVGLDELVEFSGEFFILVGDDFDVVVERVNLHLEI